jgi:hypothetical protein
VRNAAENTKTVSNRHKNSYIWGLPPFVTAERIPCTILIVST